MKENVRCSYFSPEIRGGDWDIAITISVGKVTTRKILTPVATCANRENGHLIGSPHTQREYIIYRDRATCIPSEPYCTLNYPYIDDSKVVILSRDNVIMSHPIEALTTISPDASLSATHWKPQVNQRTMNDRGRESYQFSVVLFPQHPIRRILPS